jgi:predicted DNA repair protein MutK
MLREKLRKTNWLNELRVLVLAGVVLVVGFMAYSVVRVLAGGGAIGVSISGNPSGPQEYELGGQAVRQVSTELDVLEPAGTQIGWYLASVLPSGVVLVVALSLLVRLLSRARQANPFTRATVRDLRWIAGIIVVGGVVAGYVEAIAGMQLSWRMTPEKISGEWRFPALWLLVGAGCLAVSEIVARGCDMREELDEVI